MSKLSLGTATLARLVRHALADAGCQPPAETDPAERHGFVVEAPEPIEDCLEFPHQVIARVTVHPLGNRPLDAAKAYCRVLAAAGLPAILVPARFTVERRPYVAVHRHLAQFRPQRVPAPSPATGSPPVTGPQTAGGTALYSGPDQEIAE